MMTTGVCPQCNSNTVYTKPGGKFDDQVFSGGSQYVCYLCTTCGYYESYIVEQDKLQKVATNKEWRKIEPGQRFTTLDGSPVDPQLATQLGYYMKLIQTGVEATASIASISRTKVRWYQSHDISGGVLDITFDVTAPTGEHFQSKTQSLATDITMFRYEIGKQANIKYDPANKAQCVMVGYPLKS